MKTSIIILTYNKLEYTKMCIDSIRQYTRPGSYEMIVVDNNSTDDTVAWLQQQPDLTVIYNQDNKGFPAGCNQGIEVATGDNILLLNNDVIVTKNWLEQLVHCLYSSDDIGAVGCITNHCAYRQMIPVPYRTVEDMHTFANSINKTSPELWEERLKLIGFCMLIKREVVQKVGLLDEVFTPGNFEDDDYSLRIRLAGYRLILCADTFIHHFGSTSWKDNNSKFLALLRTNEQKFEQKWGMSPITHFDFHPTLVNHITAKPDDDINVLEVHCGAGGTLLKTKSEFKNAKLFGLEPNQNAAQVARLIANVQIGSIEDPYWEGTQDFYDYIFLPNVLESVQDPKAVLQKLMRCLKPQGRLVAKIQNITHYTVFQNLMNGKSMCGDVNTRYFSLLEIEELFSFSGLEQFDIQAEKSDIPEEDEALVQQLAALSTPNMQGQYVISQWYASAIRPADESHRLLQNILQSEQVVESLSRLNQLDIERILSIAEQFTEHTVSILNDVACLNFQHGNHEHVLPYLQRAHELAPTDTDTLYNLGSILSILGNETLALHFLLKINQPDEETQQLLLQLQGKSKEQQLREQKLKFLLHRIEFEVDLEVSAHTLLSKLAEGYFSSEHLIAETQKHNIDKPKVLNALAVTAFTREQHESVLPFLQAAYEQTPTDTDTLFNLGVVLHTYGKLDMALKFLQQIANPDAEVLNLIAAVKGVSEHE